MSADPRTCPVCGRHWPVIQVALDCQHKPQPADF